MKTAESLCDISTKDIPRAWTARSTMPWPVQTIKPNPGNEKRQRMMFNTAQGLEHFWEPSVQGATWGCQWGSDKNKVLDMLRSLCLSQKWSALIHTLKECPAFCKIKSLHKKTHFSHCTYIYSAFKFQLPWSVLKATSSVFPCTTFHIGHLLGICIVGGWTTVSCFRRCTSEWNRLTRFTSAFTTYHHKHWGNRSFHTVAFYLFFTTGCTRRDVL